MLVIPKIHSKLYQAEILCYYLELTVEAPTIKTMKSVSEVIVIATPACLIVSPTSSSMGFSNHFGSFCSKLAKHWTITNISSIPIPEKIKLVILELENLYWIEMKVDGHFAARFLPIGIFIHCYFPADLYLRILSVDIISGYFFALL